MKQIKISAHPETWRDSGLMAVVDTFLAEMNSHPEGLEFTIVADPKCPRGMVYYGDPGNIIHE